MRMFVTHDEAENITRLVVGPSDGPMGTVDPEAGQTVSEVDAQGIELDFADPNLLKDPTLNDRLLAIIAQYQVARDTATGCAMLSRRSG